MARIIVKDDEESLEQHRASGRAAVACYVLTLLLAEIALAFYLLIVVIGDHDNKGLLAGVVMIVMGLIMWLMVVGPSRIVSHHYRQHFRTTGHDM